MLQHSDAFVFLVQPATWPTRRLSRPAEHGEAWHAKCAGHRRGQVSWTIEQLRERARDSITKFVRSGRRAFTRLCELLSYLDGDYKDDKTYAALRALLGDAQVPRTIWPFLPACFPWWCRTGEVSCAKNARVILEKPFGATWYRRAN